MKQNSSHYQSKRIASSKWFKTVIMSHIFGGLYERKLYSNDSSGGQANSDNWSLDDGLAKQQWEGLHGAVPGTTLRRLS